MVTITIHIPKIWGSLHRLPAGYQTLTLTPKVTTPLCFLGALILEP